MMKHVVMAEQIKEYAEKRTNNIIGGCLWNNSRPHKSDCRIGGMNQEKKSM